MFFINESVRLRVLLWESLDEVFAFSSECGEDNSCLISSGSICPILALVPGKVLSPLFMRLHPLLDSFIVPVKCSYQGRSQLQKDCGSHR